MDNKTPAQKPTSKKKGVIKLSHFLGVTSVGLLAASSCCLANAFFNGYAQHSPDIIPSMTMWGIGAALNAGTNLLSAVASDHGEHSTSQVIKKKRVFLKSLCEVGIATAVGAAACPTV